MRISRKFRIAAASGAMLGALALSTLGSGVANATTDVSPGKVQVNSPVNSNGAVKTGPVKVTQLPPGVGTVLQPPVTKPPVTLPDPCVGLHRGPVVNCPPNPCYKRLRSRIIILCPPTTTPPTTSPPTTMPPTTTTPPTHVTVTVSDPAPPVQADPTFTG